MIVVASVHSSTVIQQQLGSRNVAGKVERRTAVAAFRIDHGGIGREHLRKVIHQTKSSSGMWGKSRTPFDKKSRDVLRDLAGAEAVSPPFTHGVNAGALA